MSNKLYDKGRQKFLDGAISWSSDDIKVVLVQIGVGHYVVDLVNDEFIASIVVGDRAATTSNLTSKDSTTGIADAATATFSLVAAGPACGALVIYQDAGSFPLIAYIDDATNLPVTPNGADIVISWDAGANKIFKL
jgi:hypothetical protein